MYWSKPHLFPFLPCPICIPKQMMRYGILFPNIKSIDIYVCIGVLIFARDAWVGCLSSKPISRNAPIKIKIKAKSYMTTTMATESWKKSRLKPVPYSRVFALRSTAPKRNQWNSLREASRKLRVSVTKRFNISSPSPTPAPPTTTTLVLLPQCSLRPFGKVISDRLSFWPFVCFEPF